MEPVPGDRAFDGIGDEMHGVATGTTGHRHQHHR